MTPLHERKIVITGAFGALGRATALAAAAAGARIAMINASAQPPAELAAAFARDSFIAPADLSKSDEAATAIERAAKILGGIDALINIAGAFRWEKVENGQTSSWTSLYETNLETALNTSRAALPHLARSNAGRIVNVGANAALRAGAGMGAYAASKSAVHRLTESLADELKPQRINVNAVLPSIIDTPANRKDMPDADFSTWVTPTALANVILFLASNLSDAVTGALIPVTGRV